MMKYFFLAGHFHYARYLTQYLLELSTLCEELMEVVQCQCKAQGKMCSTLVCGCRKEYLSCTSYCNCSGEEGYCNPHTKKDKTKDGTEMVVEKDFEDTDMDEDIEEDEGFDTEYFNEDITF